jgi:hypothetical protein
VPVSMERVLLNERCELAKDLLMSYLLSHKFQNLDHIAPRWYQISQKIQDRKYETRNEFLQDIKPLLDLLKYIHKNIDFKIFDDVLDLSKPLTEIHGLKWQIDGSEKLLNTLTRETVPSSIARLFQGGRVAGRNSSQLSPATKSPALPITSDISSLTPFPSILFARQHQTPPFNGCVSHDRYYGVWTSYVNCKFVAQVQISHCYSYSSSLSVLLFP